MPYGFPQQLGLLHPLCLQTIAIDARTITCKALPEPARLPRPLLVELQCQAPRDDFQGLCAARSSTRSPEHNDLIEASHAAATLIRKNGWMEIFRTRRPGAMPDLPKAERLQGGVRRRLTSSLDAAAVARLEPHINGDFVGGLRWRDPWSVLDPHGIDDGLSHLFREPRRQVSSPATPTPSAGPASSWKVVTSEGSLDADDVVLALGPWAAVATSPARLCLPARRQARLSHALCRGKSNATLNNWTPRMRTGLFPGADEPRHPPDDGC